MEAGTMKTMHFCTPAKIGEIEATAPGDSFRTYRTGFVPCIYPGDRVQCYVRPGGRVLCVAVVESVEPWRGAPPGDEIAAYGTRKFHPCHWWFNIKMRRAE